MNRREFMLAAATAAMGGCASPDAKVAAASGQSAKADAAGGGADVPQRNRHPYKDVDWATALQIRGTTHVHCKTQEELDTILKRIEFLTLSNYYPSAPWWPISKMTENYFRLHHDFPVMVNGKRVDGPFDWNAIVGKWIKELPADLQAEYPFKEGAPIFKPLPEGVLEAPNAEHHSFRRDGNRPAPRLHMNAPGSSFASGTFDQWQKRRFQTGERGGYNFGSGEHWKTAIDRMIAGLIFPDGGGVTVNHPKWSAYDRNFMLEILDYDPRVLGIEVVEGGGNKSESYWDWVLSTGRQCFGFFVPDHSIRRKDNSFGVNVLLTPERTVQACLRAYREGNFYGAKRGLNELKFTRVTFKDATVEAETDKPARLQVITAIGPVAEVENGTSIKWTIEKPGLAAGPRNAVHMFARVKAYALDGSDEELFSQPYMLVPGVPS
ncbi:MAG: hypothetical protein IKE55_03090 [Kiritimatiellae bacterium]|nr:hypothetical protein [Kiritimatiellia bacterium]